MIRRCLEALALAPLAALAPVAGSAGEAEVFHALVLEQLEYRANQGDDLFRWEVGAWWGSNAHRLSVDFDGRAYTQGRSRGDAELQVLYNTLLTALWDLRIGVREDFSFGPGRDQNRTLATFSLAGPTPWWVELTPALFVSQDGETSARIEAVANLQITQDFVAQPRFELNLAFQNAERYGIRSGATDLELSLRLRYERWSYVAPYLGVQWIRLLGDTADLARKGGGGVDEVGLVAGFRIVY